MAGTIRGKIDCLSSTTNASNNMQEMFKNWYDFMEALVTATVAERISLQWGSSGTGTDFHDGGSPFLTNAFAAYRFPPAGSRTKDWYILGQWSSGATFGSSPGSPGLIRDFAGDSGGNFGIAFASALESDDTTNANPWNGDEDEDGGDTKGPVDGVEAGPVWVAPGGGTLAVWPKSNNFDHVTDKENTVEILSLTSGQTSNIRYGFMADDDNFFMYADYGDNLNSDWLWFGPYTPRSGYTPKYPFAMVREVGEIFFGSTFYGDSDGNDVRQGGVYIERDDAVGTAWFTSIEGGLDEDVQPSEMQASSSYEQFPLFVHLRAGVPNLKGLVGELDPFIKVAHNVADQDTTSTLDRIFIGETGLTTHHVSAPWDGSTTPGTTGTRGGVDF